MVASDYIQSMTPKQLHYSDHAARRLRGRGVTRQDVRWLLARGIHAFEPTFAGEQRQSRRGYLGHYEAKVIYIENAIRILIITVEWTDEKPGDPDV